MLLDQLCKKLQVIMDEYLNLDYMDQHEYDIGLCDHMVNFISNNITKQIRIDRYNFSELEKFMQILELFQKSAQDAGFLNTRISFVVNNVREVLQPLYNDLFGAKQSEEETMTRLENFSFETPMNIPNPQEQLVQNFSQLSVNNQHTFFNAQPDNMGTEIKSNTFNYLNNGR